MNIDPDQEDGPPTRDFILGLCTDLDATHLAFLDDDGGKWFLPLVPLTSTLRQHLACLFLFRRIAIDLRRGELWPTDPTTPGYTSVTYRLTWFELLARYTITPVNGGGVPLRTQSCPPLCGR